MSVIALARCILFFSYFCGIHRVLPHVWAFYGYCYKAFHLSGSRSEIVSLRLQIFLRSSSSLNSDTFGVTLCICSCFMF